MLYVIVGFSFFFYSTMVSGKVRLCISNGYTLYNFCNTYIVYIRIVLYVILLLDAYICFIMTIASAQS